MAALCLILKVRAAPQGLVRRLDWKRKKNTTKKESMAIRHRNQRLPIKFNIWSQKQCLHPWLRY